MKKSLLFALALLFCAILIQAKNVTPGNAGKAGVNFYYEHINRIHPADYRQIRIRETFTETFNSQPVYYAINLSEGGFVIVSADDAVTPVLGYSFEGAYSRDNQPPQFIAWMEGYARQIEYSRSRNLEPDPVVTAAWQHLLTEDPSTLTLTRDTRDVEPLIISTWDQGSNYNNLCPADPNGPGGHVWAGCVATAMSQIMYYYRYPQTGVGQHCYTPSGYPQQCADFGNTTYQWDEMLNSHSTPDTATLILLWHAGISVDMMYSPSGSGAYSSDAAAALRDHFRYNPGLRLLDKDNYSEIVWDSILIANLDQKHPLYYNGFGTGGHAFDLDGYQGPDYFHFNWGWSGSFNGYFYLNNLNPGGDNFTYGQGAIVDFFPDTVSNTYPYYCGASSVLTTLNGTFEDGSGPANNYLEGASCSWLVAPTTLSDSVESIKITFNRFNTEEGSDVVKIYQGNVTTATPFATFSGDSLPPAVTIPGLQALVTFTANGSNPQSGWFASYQSNTLNFCSTPVTLTDPEATFSDGSFHFDYKNRTNCRWIIEPEDTGATVLNFTSFRTQADHDFVKIFELGRGTLLASYSGIYDSANLPPPVTAASGKMLVIFVTDANTTEDGWEAHYKNIYLGVNDPSQMPDIKVYPNPAIGAVYIALPDVRLGELTAELIGMDGKTVRKAVFTDLSANEVKKLDLSGIPAGIYILRLVGANTVVTRKLIVE